MRNTHRLEIYRSKTLWYWRLRRKRNKKIVADGAEGYASKGNLLRAARALPLDMSRVEIRGSN